VEHALACVLSCRGDGVIVAMARRPTRLLPRQHAIAAGELTKDHGRRHEKDAASKPAHDVTKNGSFASWPKIVVDGSTSPWPTPWSTAWRNSTSL
jgi:hypothetical protein